MAKKGRPGKFTGAYISSLIDRTGISRAMIYRKLKAGWTEAEILAGQKAVKVDPMDELFPAKPAEKAEPIAAATVPENILEPPADDEKFAVTWARAVLWAADNVDTSKKRMTKHQAGSALRYNLFLLGKDDLRELHVNLVPKALNILDKNKNPEGAGIAAAEDLKAEELLATLKIALEESNRQWVERN